MSAQTRLPDEAFEWPCEKRIAHGSHWVDRSTMFACNCMSIYDQGLKPHDPDCPASGQMLCPGVAAHPNTQIGRGSLPRKRKVINFGSAV